MKILVTGGAGFIGSHIAEYLVQRGDDITVLDNLNTGSKENLAKINDKINFVNGDIRDYKLLEQLVGDIDGVFHEAALASVQQSFSMSDEYIDVNVSGTVNVNKNITTIDYGALANANAQTERNRIEASILYDKREKEALISIAEDPSKAYDYGLDNSWIAKGKIAKSFGFKKFTYYHKIPHTSLFSRVNDGYNYQNVSDNGIETMIHLWGMFPLTFVNSTAPNEFTKSIASIGLEETMKLKEIEVGKIFNDPNMQLNNAFIHKKDLNRATVFGVSGFVSTVIAEDDYDLMIIDYYNSKNGDLIAGSRVIFKGDKDEVDFEELEGRRYYFRKLIQKTIGSAQYIDIK